MVILYLIYLIPLILIDLALPEQPADDYTKPYSVEIVFALPKLHPLKKACLETLPTLHKKRLLPAGKERVLYSVYFSQ